LLNVLFLSCLSLTHTHTYTLPLFQVLLKDRIHLRICNYISQVPVTQARLFVLVFRNEMMEALVF